MRYSYLKFAERMTDRFPLAVCNAMSHSQNERDTLSWCSYASKKIYI